MSSVRRGCRTARPGVVYASASLVAALLLGGGCATRGGPGRYEPGDPTFAVQDKPFAEVQALVRELVPGASKTEVRRLLGSPSIAYHDNWQYLTKVRSPGQATPCLYVFFEIEKYKGWHRGEVVYGGAAPSP